MQDNSKQLIVFDWDGTLFNSLDWIAHCIQRTARTQSWVPPTYQEIKQLVGLGAEDVVQKLFPHIQDPTAINDFVTQYRVHYRENIPAEVGLFAGVVDLLTQLKQSGYYLAIATGKSRRELNKNLIDTGVGDYFAITRCSEESFSKPHPKMMEEILSDLQIKPEKALMIGDTDFDIHFALSANVQPIGVCYGAHDRARLIKAGAQYCLEDIRELPLLLEKSF